MLSPSATSSRAAPLAGEVGASAAPAVWEEAMGRPSIVWTQRRISKRPCWCWISFARKSPPTCAHKLSGDARQLDFSSRPGK